MNQLETFIFQKTNYLGTPCTTSTLPAVISEEEFVEQAIGSGDFGLDQEFEVIMEEIEETEAALKPNTTVATTTTVTEAELEISGDVMESLAEAMSIFGMIEADTTTTEELTTTTTTTAETTTVLCSSHKILPFLGVPGPLEPRGIAEHWISYSDIFLCFCYRRVRLKSR